MSIKIRAVGVNYVAEDFLGKVFVHKSVSGQEFTPEVAVPVRPADVPTLAAEVFGATDPRSPGFVGEYIGEFGIRHGKRFVALKDLVFRWQEYKP